MSKEFNFEEVFRKELVKEEILAIINEKDKRIADLEAKLARTQNELSAKVDYIHELVEVKDDYKQQLAEKEKELSLARNEINTLKHNLNVAQEHDKVMCEQYFNKCKETNQDKIELLEKLKGEYSAFDGIEFAGYIDTLIKEIKGE